MKNQALSKMIKVALLSAVSVILLLIEFPLFPAVPFMQFNVSDLPSLLAGFMFGWAYGCIVVVVKVLLFFLIKGTTSAGIGEISNIVIGISFVIPSALLYKRRHNIKGALISLVIGSLCMIFLSTLSNMFVMFPLFGIPVDQVFNLILWVILFNSVKCATTSLLTFLTYKRIRFLFDKF